MHKNWRDTKQGQFVNGDRYYNVNWQDTPFESKSVLSSHKQQKFSGNS